jgi:hypothetical protein
MLFKASSIIILSKYVLPNMVRARLPSPIRIKSWIVLREVIRKYPLPPPSQARRDLDKNLFESKIKILSSISMKKNPQYETTISLLLAFKSACCKREHLY